jgi:aromatic ring-opening dioxygenase LigB subunit
MFEYNRGVFCVLPIVYACIAPHGDELIPRIAGKNRRLAAESTKGMRKLASEMKDARPDTIVIASPHNLRLTKKIGVVVAENSSGKVGSRGAEISLRAKCDVEFARELVTASEQANLPVVGANYGTISGPLSNMAMDWGTLIPLWFFLKLNHLKSRIVIVTPSREIPLEQNFRFGVKVGEVGEVSKKRVAFVASADQAHAHNKKGPYGFSRSASQYDRLVVKAVERGRLSDILRFDSEMVEEAKPDSLWQMAMLAGVLKSVRMEGRLYSYQVPTYFGMLCAGYSRFRE